MTMINVKKVTENDRLSPVGGEKLGRKILNELKKSDEVTLDFQDSGSHTSLFFNALYGIILKNTHTEITEVINRIKFESLTKLDDITNNKCRDNSLRLYSDEDYKISIQNFNYEE